MQSRENLRKRSKRNSLYLIIAAVVIIVGVVAGFAIHNQHVQAEAKARKFATTHFNPNVSIYGVKVGNLTVKKATDKINQKADNVVHLKNDKVVTERDPQITTIDQATVQKYFAKQHTDVPNKANYNYTSKEFDQAKKRLNQIYKSSVTYNIAGKKYDLKAKDLIDEASYKGWKV